MQGMTRGKTITDILRGAIVVLALLGSTMLPLSAVWAQTPETMNLAKVTSLVEQLGAKQAVLTPEEKVASLLALYDIVGVEYEKPNVLGPDGDQIETKAIEGAALIWKDTTVSDASLTDRLTEYFANRPGKLTEGLGNHLVNNLSWDDKRDPRYDRIMAKVLFETFIKQPLIRNPHLNQDSDVVKDEALNKAFNRAFRFQQTLFTTTPVRLTKSDRQSMFDATADLIKQVPYLQKRGGDDNDAPPPKPAGGFIAAGTLRYQDRVADGIALHFTRIFNLNPYTNYQILSDDERKTIKEAVSSTYDLGGMDKKLWDEFGVLVNPYYKDDLQYYYNLFSGLPNFPLMMGHSRVVYLFGDWGGPADKAFDVFGPGMIEFGTHGSLHNISQYYERRINARISPERLEYLAKAMEGKGDRHLPAQVMNAHGIEKYWGWWGGSYELWATLANMYVVDSRFTFETALIGPPQRLDQFLFVLDVFSLCSNEGRFYQFGTLDAGKRRDGEYWHSRHSRPLVVTEVPLTRNARGEINGLTVDGKRYDFTLDSNGNVVNYVVSKAAR